MSRLFKTQQWDAVCESDKRLPYSHQVRVPLPGETSRPPGPVSVIPKHLVPILPLRLDPIFHNGLLDLCALSAHEQERLFHFHAELHNLRRGNSWNILDVQWALDRPVPGERIRVARGFIALSRELKNNVFGLVCEAIADLAP